MCSCVCVLKVVMVPVVVAVPIVAASAVLLLLLCNLTKNLCTNSVIHLYMVNVADICLQQANSTQVDLG